MDMKSNEDRCTTTKLLQESIIQLCKVTAGLSGNLVVDGIVCICSDDEPHQIVVKIHERLQLGVSDGFDKAIACDSNRKRGHADNALLVGTESQGKDSLRREEVNSNSGDKRHSVKKAPGREEGGKHYECGICLAKFVAKQQLVNHELKLHCKLMSHYCHACQMGFTDGMSYVRHRYSSCHRTRLRQQRRSIASNQQRPRSGHPQFGSATSCRNLRKSDTEDLPSISRPTPTPVSNEPNTATTAADGLSNTKDILPLAAGEYVICINEPDDKLQDDSRILDSVQQHPVTSGVVCKQNGSVNNIVILHKGNLASMKRSTVPLPLVKIDTKKPMLIECQDQTAGDVNAKDNDVISPSSRSNQEPPAVGKTDVSTEEQFLCEFCQQNLGTFDKYVCHVEKIHKWYPCHCCSRMFKDVFERRSHTHVEHQLPAIYCNVCHSDFFDRDMYIGHIQHCHAITDTQDGGRWYVEENSSRLLHTQSEGQVNFPLSSTQHTQSATSRVTDSVSDNAQTNEATQYKTESKIKVYDISDDESLPTVEDNDRQEHLQNPTGAAVNPPQIPPHPDRTYVCSMCSDVLCGVAAFEQHCMTAHGRYGCMYCEKLFTQKGNMRRHQLTHTGEKPYRCIVCGVAFKRKEQLTSHELSSHNIVVRSQFYTLS